MNEIILAIVIILLFTIFIIITRCLLSNDHYHIKGTIDINTLRTGDILSVSQKGYEIDTFIFFESIWRHSGIVFIKDGKPYVIEVSGRSTKNKEGVNIFDLSTWFYIYKKRNILLTRLYGGNNISSNAIDQLYDKTKHVRRCRSYWNKRRLLQVNPYCDKLNDSYDCYEYAVYLLQQLGIVKKVKLASSYSSKDVAFGILDTNLPYYYKVDREIDVRDQLYQNIL